MKDSILKRRLARGASRLFAAVLLVGGPVSWSSCEDDLLTGTPTWLGSSIYEELESRGSFKTTLALINDPDLADMNYHELLSRTGSVTLFVADDAAWQEFFRQHGVSSLSGLSRAQKRNLLQGAMINNAYLIELLGNKPGNPPSEGTCMRRASRANVGDSIPYIDASEIPALNPARVIIDSAGNVKQTDYWSAVRGRSHIYLFKDNHTPTMMHLVPEFMKRNDFVNNDIRLLTNGASQDVSRSYINGQPIALNDGRWPDKDVNTDGSSKELLQDITCQNGYIHVLERVPEQLPNMAEVIRTNPDMSIFSSLLERFSYPQFYALLRTDDQVDSIFVKRYFNEGHGSNSLSTIDETGQKVGSVLSLDPGWNTYRINTTNTDITMADDAAAIFVPNNAQMQAYLETGEGSDIGKKYGYDWDNVPDAVVLPFLNNCMKSSFVSSIPSKFSNVKNTQSEPFGASTDKLDSAFMACNGVVYKMNQIFVAPAHQSVFFPVLLRQDENMKVLYNYIADTRHKPNSENKPAYNPSWTGYENDAYVNSMASTYSFLLPCDSAFRGYDDTPNGGYIEPYSVYQNNPVSYRFFVDPNDKTFPVSAEAYPVVERDGAKYVNYGQLSPNSNQPRSTGPSGLGRVNNRLNDILNNLIIVHGQKGAQGIHAGQDIYLNKAGAPIRVKFEGDKVVGIAGSSQMERGTFIPVKQVMDLSQTGNGKSYLLDSIPMPTLTSPYNLIHDTINHPEYTAFARLLVTGSGLVDKNANKSTNHPYIGNGILSLGNYHYTIWVPKSETVQTLIDSRKLPTFEEYELWKEVVSNAKELNEERMEEGVKMKYLSDEALDSIQTLADSCQKVILTTIQNFLRYHIQDGSVYLGGAQGSSIYETAAYDDSTSLFRRLTVDNLGGAIKVKDAQGNVANVVVGDDSNKPTTQYSFSIKQEGLDGGDNARWLYGESYVVVHLIDSPLQYEGMFLPVGFARPEYLTPTPIIVSDSDVKRK